VVNARLNEGTPIVVLPAALLRSPTPAGSPSVPACAKGSELCTWIYQQTHVAWLADGSYYFLVKPIRILLIIGAAMVARYLLHRMINRLVRSTSDGAMPAMLRPLRQRLPASLHEPTGVLVERRRQRAEAIGSALRSFASATLFSIAALMILAELGVNLAPLLASAGIAGIALGFGAQSLVKDLISGLFMLLEDQYGVGDVVDLGQASGSVESVGLRTTTIRDVRGVLWYIRNGEIVRVGNKSQGWAGVVIDVPIGFADVNRATEALNQAATQLADDPQWSGHIIEPPQILGVEHLGVDGAVLRASVKTLPQSQWQVARELRQRLTQALAAAGLASQISAGRVYVRPQAPAEPPAVPPI
jgi:small conductance mechanosensitive channel